MLHQDDLFRIHSALDEWITGGYDRDYPEPASNNPKGGRDVCPTES